jgi:hypothetical protein
VGEFVFLNLLKPCNFESNRVTKRSEVTEGEATVPKKPTLPRNPHCQPHESKSNPPLQGIDETSQRLDTQGVLPQTTQPDAAQPTQYTSGPEPTYANRSEGGLRCCDPKPAPTLLPVIAPAYSL